MPPGLFVRVLIGVDREAAKQARGGFLEGKALNASQIEFLNVLVNHLTEHAMCRNPWPTRMPL